MAKLANNENPHAPSEAVMKAMTDVWRYANRYGYPDGGIVSAIAQHHGVKNENVIIGAGSTEVLKFVDDAFLSTTRKIVGPDVTYESVYRWMTNSKADAIRVPLLSNFQTDIPGIIRATKMNARDVGLVYICNPNNPTGIVIHKDEIDRLVNEVPEEIPILIDEAYHHFVDSPNYEPSIKYVLQGRKVIIARTFSKVAGLAGMRLGFSIASREVTDHMRPFALSSINAIVKYGGVAALKDTAFEARMKTLNKQLRDRTTNELRSMGYQVMPSEANFFMVNVKRDVGEVANEFRQRGVLVGRRFPPLNDWLRVSVGTDEEMQRFTAAFKQIFSSSARG
jgi:histidinol-phosphate aminotransferase